MIPCFTSNAAHEVLRNPSLSSEILSFVTQGEDIKSQGWPGPRHINHNLKTCLAVALSCTWLLEPALDELWSHLTDLLPLFMLIPGLDRMSGKIFTSKALSQSQIKRIEYHARRVRSLDILLHENPRPLAWAEASLFVQLLVLLSGKALLPRLSYLSIKGGTSPDQATLFSAMLPLLLCSNLRHVILCPMDGPKMSPSFLAATIPPISQFLHALVDMPNQRLETLMAVSQVVAVILGVLRRFSGLISFSIPEWSLSRIDYSFFRHLSTLENLRSVEMALWNSPTINVPANAANPALALHPIQHLNLVSDIQSHISVLRRYRFPSLVSAKFKIFVLPGRIPLPQAWQEVWDEFVHLLSDVSKPLNVLDIRYPKLTNSMSIPNLEWHSFTPILQLKDLTSLTVSGLKIVSFSHLECIALSNALQHLENLELDIIEITPTLLQFIVEIRTRLLCLQSLSIPLDWRTVGPHLHPDSSSKIPKHPLSSITIIGIPAAHATELRTLLERRNVSFLHDECKRLANFLFALFPDVAFSISPVVKVRGLEDFVMHALAELKAREEGETDSDSDDESF